MTALSFKLQQNKLYNKLIEKLQNEDDGVKANVLKIVNDAGDYALVKLKTVIKNMPEFTLHDEEHIFNVLFIMEKLIPPNTLDRLSVPELMLLILTSFFHDIGMAPEEKYIRAWKGDYEGLDDDFANIEHNKYQRFRNSNVKKVDEIQKLHDEDKHAVAQTLEEYLISEYIRVTHAERAREIIAKDWNGKILYKNTDLTSIFTRLCFSHNSDAMQLLEIESFELCDHDSFICIPFIAVILRLADIIDFDPKRTPSVLFSHLAVRHPISLAEWKKHQAITAWTISSDKLIYSAQCKHPAIEATIRNFCDLIDIELKNCNLILASITNQYNNDIKHYKIDLPKQVDRSKIKAMRDILTDEPVYKYQNTKFSLNKNQIIDLLMGTELYGKSEVALRELIQNSIDACLVRDKMCKAWGEEYTPHIRVSYYSKNNIDYLEVFDNGIGMDQHIIDNYYSNVGSSYYKSREFFDLMSEVNFTYKPISRFGIGVLSCFMVSDSLEVDTKRVIGKYKYTESVKVIVEGYDSIFYIRQGERTEPGTTTILQLRKVHPWQRMSRAEFKKSVKSIVQLPPFEIDIVTDDVIEKHNASEFLCLSPSSLKDYTWTKDDNIEEISIDLNNADFGFTGSALIGILVKNSRPVEKINVVLKEVEVDREKYDMSMDLQYDTCKITKSSQSIGLDGEGNIEQSTSFSTILGSKSSFSIHGIEFPNSLFPPHYYYRDTSKSVFRWPFPILLVLDLGGNSDLNLNSARTEIIYDNVWMEFERNLFKLICKELSSKLGKRKWSELKAIFSRRKESAHLLDIINA